MDDNARPYRAHIVGGFLEDEDIHRMDRTAEFLDRSPIEHASNGLERSIS